MLFSVHYFCLGITFYTLRAINLFIELLNLIAFDIFFYVHIYVYLRCF